MPIHNANNFAGPQHSTTSTRRFATATIGAAMALSSISIQAQVPRLVPPIREPGLIAPVPRPNPEQIYRVRLPNLVWSDLDTYRVQSPNSTRMRIDGYGVDDDVDLIEYDPNARIVFTEQITNQANGFASPGHRARLRMYRMQLATFQAKSTWLRSRDPIREVFSPVRGTMPGLAAGASLTARFEVTAQAQLGIGSGRTNLEGLRCGLYEVELTIDADDAVNEGLGESDNATKHYLFMQSGQTFSIDREAILETTPRVTIVTPVPIARFNFVVPGWSTVESIRYTGTNHSKRSLARIDVFSTPVNRTWGPPIAIPSDPLGTITMWASGGKPVGNYSLGEPIDVGTVSAISGDGCVFRQESHMVYVPQ